MVRAQCGFCLLFLMVVRSASAEDLRLVEAVKNRNRALVRAELTRQTDVNASEADGATALHWAVHWDDLETVELLIRAGAQ